MKRDLLILVGLTACIATSLDPWSDLTRRWQPSANSSYYRFDLPGPDRLQVELLKQAVGIHNRIWEIQIFQRPGEQISSPFRIDNFSGIDPPIGKKSRICLARRAFVRATDRIFDPQPGIWIRQLGNSWSFLSYQGVNDASEGDIVIVPRFRFNSGDSVEFGEGYFTWHPGMPAWVAK